MLNWNDLKERKTKQSKLMHINHNKNNHSFFFVYFNAINQSIKKKTQMLLIKQATLAERKANNITCAFGQFFQFTFRHSNCVSSNFNFEFDLDFHQNSKASAHTHTYIWDTPIECNAEFGFGFEYSVSLSIEWHDDCSR